ncbi:Serine/threonine-protein kinase PrkC [Planctomycetes bacterium CA13]|uniref:Serine/threonine-protein kinase PrkC n=1 Tax=Novipirellula herctigrandis TaxID=2527986 RepID=A0A5C5YY47_9BACT|nr:Serine/threonine-protein kinase PrkC [Planctomycetes bacterium CA13]
MTALLGKLKREKPTKKSSVASGFFDKDAGDCGLEVTQAYEPSNYSKSMSFTYPPGSTPLPRYTIRRGIGIGGFGEVYFAISAAGKEVALKRIQRNLEVELRGVSHCLNLKHPNLVALFDICHDESDQAWVVMEYVAGKNLRQVLDELPNGLNESEARRWFSAIAKGVHHLHGAGLVHRDLKPGNVFDDLGIVKVGDYGLSKFISSSHRGGHTESVGTFHYMAPEIGRGEYGREIDIYALGIMLFELLTGNVPFDGESCHEIIVKHMTAKPDLSQIGEPYRSVIAKSLEKDPAKRFATVTEMTNALSMNVDGHAATHAATHPIVAKLAETSPMEVHPLPEAQSPKPPLSAHKDCSPEPFARAVRASFSDLERWWRSLDRSPGAKAFLFLTGFFVLFINTHWLLPLLTVIGIVYVPYYVVRQMVLHVSQQPSYAKAQASANQLAALHGPSPRPMTKAQWREHMRNDLRAKHTLHRAAELNTSWITATAITMGLALCAGVIGLRSGPVDSFAIAPYGAMALVVLVASLTILGFGKLWERDEGESLPRRIVLAGVGAGVGIVAYSAYQFLMLPLDVGLGREIDSTTLPQALYWDNEIPKASAMMVHFALLFSALRWWKAVDPLRRNRLSIWSVVVAVAAEWAVHQVLPIPQPAGILTAGAIAIAIQMSAPWVNPRLWSKSKTEPAPSRNPIVPTPYPANESVANRGGVA